MASSLHHLVNNNNKNDDNSSTASAESAPQHNVDCLVKCPECNHGFNSFQVNIFIPKCDVVFQQTKEVVDWWLADVDESSSVN